MKNLCLYYAALQVHTCANADADLIGFAETLQSLTAFV